MPVVPRHGSRTPSVGARGAYRRRAGSRPPPGPCAMRQLRRIPPRGRLTPAARPLGHAAAAATRAGPAPARSTDAPVYNSRLRSLSALPMTETELRVIAALAQIGLIRRPTTG